MTDPNTAREADLMKRLGLGRQRDKACDFCERPPAQASPVWAYPVAALTIEIAGIPVELDFAALSGAWIACDTCAAFIEANDYPGLALHMGHAPGVAPSSLQTFRQARIGPPQRL